MATRKTAPLSHRVLVTIHRDATTITPRVVWQHELPILEAVFGEGNVRPVEPKSLDEGFAKKISPELLPFNKQQDPVLPPSETARVGYVFIGDPRAEYDRLAQVYGKHPEVNESFAEHVYGRFQSGDFARIVGRPEVEDLPEQQLRDLAKEHGYLPIVSEKSSDADKQKASDMQRELQTMPHDALVKLAGELGVEIA
jgi:hypothetical protein